MKTIEIVCHECRTAEMREDRSDGSVDSIECSKCRRRVFFRHSARVVTFGDTTGADAAAMSPETEPEPETEEEMIARLTTWSRVLDADSRRYARILLERAVEKDGEISDEEAGDVTILLGRALNMIDDLEAQVEELSKTGGAGK